MVKLRHGDDVGADDDCTRQIGLFWVQVLLVNED